LYDHYCNGGYGYLEINPFTVVGANVEPLDCVAKLDDTAEFECRDLWGSIDYPAPFGQKLTEEEEYIRELDSKTGASLKFTLLNPKGRIWNMVAGGGASVVYADTVCDLGQSSELAMYGEYSGNPDKNNTYQYAKTVIDLLTREKDAQGRPKILLVGGGIANFTDVAKTFTGIIMAIEEYADKLKEVDARIYVRRGGPNYKEGLMKIKAAAEKLGIPIEVHGPEAHMTQIVADALNA
jgi:ATP-citrate lyase beta-subunit